METDAFFAMRDKCLAFIESRLTWPFNVPAERWEEGAICLEAIALKKNALRLVPRRFWRDAAFCQEAVKRRAEAIDYVSEDLITEALLLEALKQDGTALYFIPKRRLTLAIITAAVKQNPYALQFVPDEWRDEAKQAIAEKEAEQEKELTR